MALSLLPLPSDAVSDMDVLLCLALGQRSEQKGQKCWGGSSVYAGGKSSLFLMAVISGHDVTRFSLAQRIQT